MTRDKSPVIGITTRRMDAGARRLDVVDQAYGTAIWQAGGTAHLLPRPPGAAGDRALAGLDGLLLTGGGDVDPGHYGHAPSPEIGGVDADRDDWEIALVQQALELGMPVLGVCRGCQVLNVALGGTLIQHLPARSPLPHLVVGAGIDSAYACRSSPARSCSRWRGRTALASTASITRPWMRSAKVFVPRRGPRTEPLRRLSI